MSGSTAPVERYGVPFLGAALVVAAVIGGALVYTSTGGSGRDVLIDELLINIVVVMGLQVFVGTTGVLSLGHAAFALIAGYTTFLLAAPESAKAAAIPDAPFGLDTVQLSPWLATGLGIVAAALAGLVLAAAMARSPAVTATMITIAFLFVVHEVANNWDELTGGAGGLSDRSGSILFEGRTWLYVGVAVAVIGARLFKASPAGRFALASSEDELATAAMGVSVPWVRTVALVTSAAMVGLGAALRVQSLGAISPKQYYFDYVLLTLAMLVLGGKRSVTGAVLGVAVITAGRELALKWAEGDENLGALPELLEGVVILAVMLLRPKGLLGDWELDRVFRRRRLPQKPPSPEPVEAVTPTALEAVDVSVRFGGFTALDEVGLHARSSEVVGLIGPNGAGKTTLLNTITGLVPPSEGEVTLGDRVLTGRPVHEVARAGLARTFQNLRLFPELTVREHVEVAALAAHRHRSDRPPVDVDGLLAAAGLWDRQERRARELDYGSQRRLELVRAAALRPTFLLLDEPTSGMSESESAAMIDHVRQTAAAVGAGVVVIDHDLHFIVRICDRIEVLDQGRVIAVGRPAEVTTDPKVIAAYLGEGPTEAPAPDAQTGSAPDAQTGTAPR